MIKMGALRVVVPLLGILATVAMSAARASASDLEPIKGAISVGIESLLSTDDVVRRSKRQTSFSELGKSKEQLADWSSFLDFAQNPNRGSQAASC